MQGQKNGDNQTLDEFLQAVLKEYHVPGLAIGVVDGDETWCKGYGYAELPSKAMTPSHLFYAGSTTKSFSAAAMSLLVDDDTTFPNVQWSTPMSFLLRNDFVLSDNWATSHITVEDALSHRTGYPSHTMGVDNKTPRECTRRLRHLPMSAEPRTRWQYNNYMFTAVGLAIEVLTGQWLGDFFRERLWEPMGMTSTFLRREDAEKDGENELATEYWWNEAAQEHVVVPHLPDGRGREGAGMVISNVHDYIHYLRVMIDEAAPISAAGHVALKTPRSIVPTSSPCESPLVYSLGWVGGVMEGYNYWSHNGRIREHICGMWFVPGRRFAFVVMLNANQPSALTAISERITRHYLGKSFAGHQRETRRQKHQMCSQTSESCRREFYPRLPNPPLPRPISLDQYVGNFHNPGYDNIHLRLERQTTTTNEARLVTGRMMGFDGLYFYLVMEHVSGDYWLAWAYIVEHVSAGMVPQPETCIRAQTELGSDGNVQRVGFDLRQEGLEGPLVWFNRADG